MAVVVEVAVLKSSDELNADVDILITLMTQLDNDSVYRDVNASP